MLFFLSSFSGNIYRDLFKIHMMHKVLNDSSFKVELDMICTDRNFVFRLLYLIPLYVFMKLKLKIKNFHDKICGDTVMPAGLIRNQKVQ
jgi:hypothetical protein